MVRGGLEGAGAAAASSTVPERARVFEVGAADQSVMLPGRVPGSRSADTQQGRARLREYPPKNPCLRAGASPAEGVRGLRIRASDLAICRSRREELVHWRRPGERLREASLVTSSPSMRASWLCWVAQRRGSSTVAKHLHHVLEEHCHRATVHHVAPTRSPPPWPRHSHTGQFKHVFHNTKNGVSKKFWRVNPHLSTPR